MALETRRNRSYYYRKERQGSKVRSVYIGSGETARLMSLLDESRTREEQLRRAHTQMEREGFEAHDETVEQACSMVEMLTDATLLAAGFHTHKRQWRRKNK
jgi:hypothetical protein